MACVHSCMLIPMICAHIDVPLLRTYPTRLAGIVGFHRSIAITKDCDLPYRVRGDEGQAKRAKMDLLCDNLGEEVNILDDGPNKEALVWVEPSSLTTVEKMALVAPRSRLFPFGL